MKPIEEFLGAHEALFGRISGIVSTSRPSEKSCSCCSATDSVLRHIERVGKTAPAKLPTVLELPLCEECFGEITRKVMLDRLSEARRAVSAVPSTRGNIERKNLILSVIEDLLKETKGWEQ